MACQVCGSRPDALARTCFAGLRLPERPGRRDRLEWDTIGLFMKVFHGWRMVAAGTTLQLFQAALMQQALLHPNPRFVLTLRAEHAGQSLPASVWQEGLSTGVLALEETLYV